MGGYYGKYWEILNKYYVVGAHYRLYAPLSEALLKADGEIE